MNQNQIDDELYFESQVTDYNSGNQEFEDIKKIMKIIYFIKLYLILKLMTDLLNSYLSAITNLI